MAAEKIVSPGVFINEKDQSFRAENAGNGGCAFIGPFKKGPAFVPTVVNTRNNAIDQFGDTYEKFYTQYAVQEYLKHADAATLVRVLWEEGYQADTIKIYSEAGSTMAILAPTSTTGTLGALTMSAACDYDAVIFSVGTTAYTCSFDTSDSNYITKVFGTSPYGSKAMYVYGYYPTDASESIAADVTASKSTDGLDFTTNLSYTYASTPYVISQQVNGTSTNLFKFKTISDGNEVNTSIKIGIYNIREPGTINGTDYGTFSVLVREHDDTDNKPSLLETFNNLSLDPDATNYIARVIGDRYATTDSDGEVAYSGNYPNRSSYIYVDMESIVSNGAISADLIPWGFDAPKFPYEDDTSAPIATYVVNQTDNGETNTKIFYGWDYSESDNDIYYTALSDNAGTGSNTQFHLDDYSAYSSASTAKQFMIPVQGGFDGCSPANDYTTDTTELMGFLVNSSTASGSVSYKKAVDTLQNPDDININLLCIPGVSLNNESSIYTHAKNMCEDRGDVLFVLDTGREDMTITNAAASTDSVDSSYMAVYYPWVKIADSNTNKLIWVPAATAIPAAIAYNDKVGYPWYAPAGFSRGSLDFVLEAKKRLKHTDRDTLYEARVNPIATFPDKGNVIYGQKTLYAKLSALDRVNVRRLLIALKKEINNISRKLNFEQNTITLRSQFINEVSPYMSNIQQNQGLYAFKIQMDETTNTADVIDRNELRGEIYIQPTKTAEYIIIGLNITPTGATFEG